MRLCMRSPLFLFIFTIFSVLYFGLTAIAQESGLAVVQGTYQSTSPAKRALEEARAAKEAAEKGEKQSLIKTNLHPSSHPS